MKKDRLPIEPVLTEDELKVCTDKLMKKLKKRDEKLRSKTIVIEDEPVHDSDSSQDLFVLPKIVRSRKDPSPLRDRESSFKQVTQHDPPAPQSPVKKKQ